MRHRTKKAIQCGIFAFLFAAASLPVFADPISDAGLVATGAGKIISGVLSLPIEILKGAVSSFPFGIIGGAIRGTAQTISGVVGGSVDAATGAAPYAQYAAFL